MRRDETREQMWRRRLVPVLLLASALWWPGCVAGPDGVNRPFWEAMTPRQKLRLAYDSYASVMSTLADMKRAGMLTDETVKLVEAFRVAAREALDTWDEKLDAGDTSVATEIDRFNQALDILIAARLDALEQYRKEYD